METVAGRTYKVKRNEFPLTILIAPKNSNGNKATTVIVGHIRAVKNGVEVDERDADMDDEQGVLSYQIDAPQSDGSLDIVQTLLGFFADSEDDSARFEITIQTAGGDRATTSIRRPTFNPGTANLKFQVQ
jgi:hypothetical protein